MTVVAGRQDVKRLAYADNLKTILVAWIIAGHGLLGYAAIGGWPYDEVNEVTLPTRIELILAVFLGPSALFVIGVFFFISGLFVPGALRRRGPARFAVERLLNSQDRRRYARRYCHGTTDSARLAVRAMELSPVWRTPAA